MSSATRPKTTTTTLKAFTFCLSHSQLGYRQPLGLQFHAFLFTRNNENTWTKLFWWSIEWDGFISRHFFIDFLNHHHKRALLFHKSGSSFTTSAWCASSDGACCCSGWSCRSSCGSTGAPVGSASASCWAFAWCGRSSRPTGSERKKCEFHENGTKFENDLGRICGN